MKKCAYAIVGTTEVIGESAYRKFMLGNPRRPDDQVEPKFFIGINNYKEGQSGVGEVRSSYEVIVMIMEQRDLTIKHLFQTRTKGPIVYDYYGAIVLKPRH
jgi:hypothetical protein